MKKNILTLALCLVCCGIATAQSAKPWDNGPLKVSDNHRYLIHQNGTPFFWLGNTSWLMPERLNRDDVEFYLTMAIGNISTTSWILPLRRASISPWTASGDRKSTR